MLGNFRRFEIEHPVQNSQFEPRKFSSKHSEFVKLKAVAIMSKPVTKEQYKVVIEYANN